MLVDKLISFSLQRSNDLLLIHVSGKVKRSRPGLPQLVLYDIQNDSEILAFDFVIYDSPYSGKKVIECEVHLVLKLSDMPFGIKAIKVNAEMNSDIIPIDIID